MKLMRIKWENIVLVLLTMLMITCLVKHNINDFNWEMFLFEIIIHTMLMAMQYIGLYWLRQELLNK